MPKAEGSLRRGNKVLPREDKSKLADLGLTKIESHRWQREAEVPDGKFETWVAEKNAARQELTQAELLQIANDRRKRRVVNEGRPNENVLLAAISMPSRGRDCRAYLKCNLVTDSVT